MVMVIVKCGVGVVIRMEFGVCLPSVATELTKLGSLNLNVCQFLFFTQFRGDSLHNCQLFPNCLVKIDFAAELVLYCFFQPSPRSSLSG
jgi:hypothetical protein